MNKPNLMPNMKFGSMQHKQAAQTLKKALEEDPTVFQYDEVYDDMDKERTEKRELAKGDRKPKYIGELMKTAERRQRENERRIEKQAQKDLEKEGDMYKDKEAFVTGAYKRKMEELRRLEEEEKHQDALDDMAEVTKQKDLSGFYRHLFRQTMNEEKSGKEEKAGKTTVESSPSKKAKYEKTSSNEEESDTPRHESPVRHQSSTSGKDIENPHQRDKGKELDRHKDKRHHHRDRSPVRNTEKERRRDNDDKRHGRDKGGERSRHSREDQDRGHERRYRSRERSRFPRRQKRSRSLSRTPRRHRSSRSRSPRLERGRKSEKSGHKENHRPQTSSSSAAKGVDSQSSGLPTKQGAGHPVWKKRTIGDVLEDAINRYFQRKDAGLVVPIIASEK